MSEGNGDFYKKVGIQKNILHPKSKLPVFFWYEFTFLYCTVLYTENSSQNLEQQKDQKSANTQTDSKDKRRIVNI